MTISAKLYEVINNELIGVIEKYRSDLTQYDMLQICVNFLICYIDVVEKFDNIERHKIIDEVFKLIQNRNASDFMKEMTTRK